MNPFAKKIAVTAALIGALTVVIGAFGAHGLEKLVDPETATGFETGVRYQMYHVLLLLILVFSRTLVRKYLVQLFWIFLLGMILFSGSIYLLALDEAMGVDLSAIGPVTPVGGLLLIIGWLRLGWVLLTMERG